MYKILLILLSFCLVLVSTQTLKAEAIKELEDIEAADGIDEIDDVDDEKIDGKVVILKYDVIHKGEVIGFRKVAITFDGTDKTIESTVKYEVKGHRGNRKEDLTRVITFDEDGILSWTITNNKTGGNSTGNREDGVLNITLVGPKGEITNREIAMDNFDIVFPEKVMDPEFSFAPENSGESVDKRFLFLATGMVSDMTIKYEKDVELTIDENNYHTALFIFTGKRGMPTKHWYNINTGVMVRHEIKNKKGSSIIFKRVLRRDIDIDDAH